MQRQFESVVTALSQDAFGGSSSDNGTTLSQFDLRKRDLQCALGTPATLGGRQEPSHGDRHALSTFHNPIKYRCIVAPGSSFHDQNPRGSFTPDIQGVSTSQPMSQSIIRLACARAVVCGGSLRHMALLFAALCLSPLTTASIKRWMDAIGSNFPTPEPLLQPLLPCLPVTACPRDGYSPLGPDHWVRVGKAEQDRSLMTQEAASENGDAATQLLQRLKDRGLKVPAACSEYAPSFPAALKAV